MATLRTSKGLAYWPHIFTPDTQFNSDGDYSVKFRVSGEDAINLQKKVDALGEESVQKAKTENPSKKIKLANVPYNEVLDETGNPTGQLEFKFKQKAKIQTKNGPMDMKVAVLDAKGTPITEPVNMANGSEVKVAFEPNLYYVPSSGAGVSLRLKAVQIINLIEYESNDFGFGEEEGYTHDNNNNNGSDNAQEDNEEFFGNNEDEEEEDF